MMHFKLDDLLDIFEKQYQFKHTDNQLMDFRCLTAEDGEVYIEYRIQRKQFNTWVSMNDERIYKRVVSVEDISPQPVYFREEDNWPQQETDWGPAQGNETW